MQPNRQSPDDHLQPTARKRAFSFFSSLGVLLIAPLVATLLIMFVFQSYQVDGYSMQNTLQNGDRLIVWKGSRTWARIVGSQYIPKRGDVIIVNQPDLTACNQPGSKQIVKRVIGLPGEHVLYKNGRYIVYNHEHPEGFNPDESLPYGKQHTALLSDPGAGNADITLSTTQLFVSGDHRADSCDSRYFGPIESKNIIGKVISRIFPIQEAENF